MSINLYTLKQIRTKHHRYDLEGFQITSPLVCYNLLQSSLSSPNRRSSLGDPTPSRDDIFLTQRLKKAGKIMCIELIHRQ